MKDGDEIIGVEYLVRQARCEVDWTKIQAEYPGEAAEQFAAERDEQGSGDIAKGDPIVVEVKRSGRWEIDKFRVVGRISPSYSAIKDVG